MIITCYIYSEHDFYGIYTRVLNLIFFLNSCDCVDVINRKKGEGAKSNVKREKEREYIKIIKGH